MDIAVMVETVCQQLASRGVYRDALGDVALVQPGTGGSRHSRQYKRCRQEEERQETLPLAYRHAVDGPLRRYQALMATPVPYTGIFLKEGACPAPGTQGSET